jgi:hypothetical protein
MRGATMPPRKSCGRFRPKFRAWVDEHARKKDMIRAYRGSSPEFSLCGAWPPEREAQWRQESGGAKLFA